MLKDGEMWDLKWVNCWVNQHSICRNAPIQIHSMLFDLVFVCVCVCKLCGQYVYYYYFIYKYFNIVCFMTRIFIGW